MRNFFLVLALAAAAAWAQQPRRAPGFSLPDSKFNLYDLYDFHGKPVILEFMQSTCPHCQIFAGILEMLHEKYGASVGILSIANPPDNQTTIGHFISGHQITYPIVFDCGQAAFSYVHAQRFDLPQVFLIDQEGMIRNQYSYSPETLQIFEGNALGPEVEKLLKPGASKK